MKLNAKSIERLSEVHPDLQRVIYRAAENVEEDGFGLIATKYDLDISVDEALEALK